jgi:hypothetical protein
LLEFDGHNPCWAKSPESKANLQVWSRFLRLATTICSVKRRNMRNNAGMNKSTNASIRHTMNAVRDVVAGEMSMLNVGLPNKGLVEFASSNA